MNAWLKQWLFITNQKYMNMIKIDTVSKPCLLKPSCSYSCNCFPQKGPAALWRWRFSKGTNPSRSDFSSFESFPWFLVFVYLVVVSFHSPKWPMSLIFNWRTRSSRSATWKPVTRKRRRDTTHWDPMGPWGWWCRCLVGQTCCCGWISLWPKS